MESVFKKLNAVDVSSKVEKKNDLTYLAWAYAWGEVKKEYPTANYAIYKNAEGFNYHHDNRTAWVEVGVTIEALEHIEHLPVMDYRNKSIPVKELTSFDVNKAIQRAMVKAIARHGLGLYIYAGEDLPEATTPVRPEKPATARPEAPKAEPVSDTIVVTGKVDKIGKANKGGYIPHTLLGVRMEDGTDIKFTSKDDGIISTLAQAKEIGAAVKITAKKTEYKGFASIDSVEDAEVVPF
jgi:hypothetical protein